MGVLESDTPVMPYCSQFDQTIEEYPVMNAKMQEKKVQPQQPMQNLQMMRAEPRQEDPKLNIVLRSKVTTGDYKGKQSEEDIWVHKAHKRKLVLIWYA